MTGVAARGGITGLSIGGPSNTGGWGSSACGTGRGGSDVGSFSMTSTSATIVLGGV